ncbi:hypothetical protein C772_02274 [Bhargavaea cecembensis DSE10]|uniref:Uncharacterized protein n=1 Tax=Bhargavaea cecembensis DSE10 TaxID=1235279 RepID=M7NF47_9BACL|nr:hypothetical protein C772_02274 [Bhargavaea cecembensis DSE10]
MSVGLKKIPHFIHFTVNYHSNEFFDVHFIEGAKHLGVVPGRLRQTPKVIQPLACKDSIPEAGNEEASHRLLNA